MSLGHSALKQNPLFTTHIEQAQTRLRTQALPDSPTLMPKTRTTSERDVLRDEFIACHMELLAHKNDVMEAEAGQSCKAAIDTMRASLVSSFICGIFSIFANLLLHVCKTTLESIMDHMTNHPPGGWDLDNCEDIANWAKTICTLEPSKSSRKLLLDLKTMSAKITAISEPIEFDDEARKHEEDASKKEAPPVKYEKVPSQIRVKPRVTVPVCVEDLVELVANKIKV